MFILRGTRTVRIKTYQDHDNQCSECKDFNLTVGVFTEYYHVFFIPFAAYGGKSTKMYCASCGQPVRIDSLSRQYEKKTRAPFYLYSGIILIGLLVAAGLAVSAFGSYQRTGYIDHPQVGDVYLVKRDEPAPTAWYFLRIAEMKGDTALVYHSSLQYNAAVYAFNTEDYFVSDEEVGYTTAQLKTMYEKGTISSVFRDYNGTGFNRIK